MTRRSGDRGPPNLTKPSEIRKMLRLANANKNDIFYDFGCGHGRVCIHAARKVKKAVGIEDHYYTYKEAVSQARCSDVSDKIIIRHSDIDTARFGDATIVYACLKEEIGDRKHYERILKRGCRLVTREIPLIGIKPDKIDFPFYLMYIPFKYAEDVQDWARSILRTKNATPQRLYKKLRRYSWGPECVRDVKKYFNSR
jgi:SAM-dependent methyltransferase